MYLIQMNSETFSNSHNSLTKEMHKQEVQKRKKSGTVNIQGCFLSAIIQIFVLRLQRISKLLQSLLHAGGIILYSFVWLLTMEQLAEFTAESLG